MRSIHSSSALVLIAAIVSLLTAAQAGAVPVYSNFGPGDSYDPTSGHGIGKLGTWPNLTCVSQFSVASPQSYALDSIELAADSFIPGANQLDVSLVADAAGLPGTVLESFSFTDQMVVADSSAHPDLRRAPRADIGEQLLARRLRSGHHAGVLALDVAERGWGVGREY